MMLGSTLTAAEEKALKREKAAAYAASLQAQVSDNAAFKSNNGAPAVQETVIRGNVSKDMHNEEQERKKEKQLEYRRMLDAQVTSNKGNNNGMDEDIVPTALKDRPF